MSSQHYGGIGAGADAESIDTDNLFDFIDRDKIHGLNLSVPENARELIKPWSEREDTTRFVDSVVDDELIIHIPFTQSVNLKSVLLKLGRGEYTPHRMRIYANYANIVDFSEAEDLSPHLDISLSTDMESVQVYPVNQASTAFVSVNSLSLFFSEAVGQEVSRLYYIGFRGQSRRLQKEGLQKLEVPAANAADAPLVDRLREKAAGAQSFAR